MFRNCKYLRNLSEASDSFKKLTLFSLIFVTFLLAFQSVSMATHFRYGNISWERRPDIDKNAVSFVFTAAFRRDGYTGSASDGFPQIGDVIVETIGETQLNFGDNNDTDELSFEIISYDDVNNWIIGIAELPTSSYDKEIIHVYDDSDIYTAYIQSCCRVSSNSGHINNPDGEYRLETEVDLNSENTPPVSSLTPIIKVEQNSNAVFNVPANDVDKDTLSWRLSTSYEASGGRSLFDQPVGLTIDGTTGDASWDTTGLTLGLYSCQVTIEDGETSIPVDFFIEVVEETVNNSPVFNVPPNPEDGEEFSVSAGNLLEIMIVATDSDQGDSLSLNHAGLPDGADFDITTNPNNSLTGLFSWTPTKDDEGVYVVNFVVEDTGGLNATHSVNIIVEVQKGKTTGTIYDASSFLPLSGVTVSADMQNTSSITNYSTTTDANGEYTLEGQEVGEYTVTASISGYESGTQSGVTVEDGVTTTVDLYIDQIVPASCTYTLTISSDSFTYAGDIGFISVVTSETSCDWTVESDSGWIIITSGSSGIGISSIEFAVGPNTEDFGRTGTITVQGDTIRESFTITQTSTDCEFSISSSNKAFGYEDDTGSIVVFTDSGCGWTTVSNDSWITILDGDSESGDGTAIYSVLENTSTNKRTGTITIANKTFVVTQEGTPICDISLSAANKSFDFSGGSGRIDLSGDSDCRWAATSNDDWILVISGNTGRGTGAVIYSVDENDSVNAREGAIIIAGKSFAVDQEGREDCVLSISSSNKLFGSTGGSGLVDVSTATTDCSWTSASTVSWITITSGDTGTGNDTMFYAVSENENVNARSGTMIIAGKTFTVDQDGSPSCNITISATTKNFDATGGTGNVTVTTATGDCEWTAASHDDWIVISSGTRGTGSGSISYSVDVNIDENDRTGTMTIAGMTFTVRQESAIICDNSISSAGKDFETNGGTGTIVVRTPTGDCLWTAETTESWITITSGSHGQGTDTVQYSVAANSDNNDRAGTIVVAGRDFTVTQDPSPICEFLASSVTKDFGPDGGTGEIIVTADLGDSCVWTVVSNKSWIVITSGPYEEGSSTAYYTVLGNTSIDPRDGTIDFADKQFTITQDGDDGCSYAISSSSKSFDYDGGFGNVIVTVTGDDCTWTAASEDTWITILSGTGGSESGTVSYEVAANTGTGPRTGTMTITGRTFTVTQDGIALCLYDISPDDKTFGASGGIDIIQVDTSDGCTWTAASSDNWITIVSGGSETGTGVVTYSVAENDDGYERIGTILIAGQEFPVVQTPGIVNDDGCSTYNLQTEQLYVPSLDAGGLGRFEVMLEAPYNIISLVSVTPEGDCLDPIYNSRTGILSIFGLEVKGLGNFDIILEPDYNIVSLIPIL